MATATSQQTVLDRWMNVSPHMFENELEQEWQAFTTLRDTVIQLVSKEQIKPYQGIGILSDTANRIFGFGATPHNSQSGSLTSY